MSTDYNKSIEYLGQVASSDDNKFLELVSNSSKEIQAAIDVIKNLPDDKEALKDLGKKVITDLNKKFEKFDIKVISENDPKIKVFLSTQGAIKEVKKALDQIKGGSLGGAPVEEVDKKAAHEADPLKKIAIETNDNFHDLDFATSKKEMKPGGKFEKEEFIIRPSSQPDSYVVVCDKGETHRLFTWHRETNEFVLTNQTKEKNAYMSPLKTIDQYLIDVKKSTKESKEALENFNKSVLEDKGFNTKENLSEKDLEDMPVGTYFINKQGGEFLLYGTRAISKKAELGGADIGKLDIFAVKISYDPKRKEINYKQLEGNTQYPIYFFGKKFENLQELLKALNLTTPLKPK